MLVSGPLEKEETGRFPEGQALQKPQVMSQGKICVVSQDGDGWPSVRHLPRAGHPPSVTPTTVAQPPHRVHTPPAGPASGPCSWDPAGASGGSSRRWHQPGSRAQDHLPRQPPPVPRARVRSVPGFLEAASGHVVLSLGGRLQTPAQGLSSSSAPTPALASPSPCPRCCHHGSLVELMAELRAGVSGDGLSAGRSCLNSKLAAPGAVSRPWAGPGPPYGGGQVGSQQWPLVRGPCGPWGLTMPRRGVEVLGRQVAGALCGCSLLGPSEGVSSTAERGWGWIWGSASEKWCPHEGQSEGPCLPPAAPDVLASPAPHHVPACSPRPPASWGCSVARAGV